MFCSDMGREIRKSIRGTPMHRFMNKIWLGCTFLLAASFAYVGYRRLTDLKQVPAIKDRETKRDEHFQELMQYKIQELEKLQQEVIHEEQGRV